MTNIVVPGNGILYMKVGTHAGESLDSIIRRKTEEIERAGVSFWGYGGNTCHPESMVQPFARSYHDRGKPVYLCMEPMESNHWSVSARADEYSVNGITWEVMPEAINVIGSRYALVIKELQKADFDLRLDETRVALGNSMGRSGQKYIQGRVDKACLEVVEATGHEKAARVEGIKMPIQHIGLVAQLASPFAVYVRNTK
ncbi:MAG: hypothetical protein H0U76_13415 [Ktedonobacteraceae bacterium]|nr:hypothetical protein [Ktedonobacteraceae bacterium]